jgi:hypothetical protein
LTGKIATAILFLALGLGASGAARAADSIPLDEYWRRIDAAADLLAGGEADATTIAALADDLAAIERVELPGGQILPVDNGDLVATLRRSDLSQDEVEAVLARLRAIQDTRDASAGQPAQATEQTFARLEEILARSEFTQARQEPAREESLLQRVLLWLRRELFRWLSRLGNVPGMSYLLAALGVAVVLAVLAYAFSGAWRQWASEGRAGGDAAPGDEVDLSSGEALRRADALAAGGDYRQAVRYLYLSTLLWLDEHRLLRYDPALTNREFLHQLERDAGHARLREALSPVVELFDRVWYGFAPLDDRGYGAFARQVEQVRQVPGGDA